MTLHAFGGSDLEVRDGTTGEIRDALDVDGEWLACADGVAAYRTSGPSLVIVDRPSGRVRATIDLVAEGLRRAAGPDGVEPSVRTSAGFDVEFAARGDRLGMTQRPGSGDPSEPDAVVGSGVSIFQASDGIRSHRLEIVDPSAVPTCLAISDDGSRVAVGGVEGGVTVWELGSGGATEGPPRVLARRRSADDPGAAEPSVPAPVRALAFDRSGSRIASGHADGTIHVLDLERSDDIVLRGHVAAVVSLVFLPGGALRDRWVSGSLDRTLRIWDARGGDPLLVIDRRSPARSLDARVGGGGLLVAGQAGEIDRLDPDLSPADLVAYRDARARARRLAPRVVDWAEDALAALVGASGTETLEDQLVRRIERERDRANLTPAQEGAAVHLVRQGDIIDDALIEVAMKELQRIDAEGYNDGVMFGDDETFDICMLGIGRMLVGDSEAAVTRLETARSRAVEGDPRVGDYYLALAYRRLGRDGDADLLLHEVRAAVEATGDSRLTRIYAVLDRMASPQG